MIHAFDAGPLIAFLSAETGGEVTRQILRDNPGECYAHIANLAEVYYIAWKRGGEPAAEKALQRLAAAGVIAREDSDEAFWKEAASYKGRHPMALPDGYCIALARRLGGSVVTTDRAEFTPLIPLNYAPIVFIR